MAVGWLFSRFSLGAKTSLIQKSISKYLHLCSWICLFSSSLWEIFFVLLPSFKPGECSYVSKNGRQDPLLKGVGKKSALFYAVTVIPVQDIYMFFSDFTGNTLSFTFTEPHWLMLGNTCAEWAASWEMTVLKPVLPSRTPMVRLHSLFYCHIQTDHVLNLPAGQRA